MREWQAIDTAPKDGSRFLVTRGVIETDPIITPYRGMTRWDGVGFQVLDLGTSANTYWFKPKHWMRELG
jgi:hypothetical protein